MQSVRQAITYFVTKKVVPRERCTIMIDKLMSRKNVVTVVLQPTQNSNISTHLSSSVKFHSFHSFLFAVHPAYLLTLFRFPPPFLSCSTSFYLLFYSNYPLAQHVVNPSMLSSSIELNVGVVCSSRFFK